MNVIRCALVAALLAAVPLAGAAAVRSSASRTRMTPMQVAHMNTCLEQQNDPAGYAEACAEFVRSPTGAARVRLSEAQAAWMSECVDQQTGEGTIGAGDACAYFVRKPRHKQ